MAAKDRFHEIVRLALEKDGWRITHDPLSITVEKVNMQIDLGAERVLGAERAGQKIAIEIKSFLGPSSIQDFYLALGQTITYRGALQTTEPDRTLYLAISNDTYTEFFINKFIQDTIQANQVKLLIFEIETQTINSWKE